MEELGDWVYIILMVVVGISSLISSANKKKRQQQMQMPSPVSEPSEEYEMPYPTPSVPKKKEKILPPPVPGQSKRQPYGAHVTYSDSGTQTEILRSQEDENTLINELELTDPDSFRKAVIYTEILKRKY